MDHDLDEKDLQSTARQRTLFLKRKGVNDLDPDIPKFRGVGSLEVRNKYAHVLYSIDILQEVTACVQGEGHDLNPACLTGTHKVSLLFGNKKSAQSPEHLTLYVKIVECKGKPDPSQLDVVLRFGRDEGGPTKEDCDAWQKLKQVLDSEFEKALRKRSGRQKSMSMRQRKDSSNQSSNQYFLELYADSANDSLTYENRS